MKLPEENAGSFTPTPAGQHVCVLTRLIDLGTQPGSGMYPKPKRKVLFGWEIPGERVKYEKDGVEHEGPVLHFERMTFSSHQNAVMRQRLETWRGKPFSPEEFGNFDMKTLLGVGALIQIAHEHKDGRTYANLQAIMLPPGGRAAWPQPEGETVYISLDPDEFDPIAFSKLSENLQKTISGSPEYQSIAGTNQQSDMGAGQTDSVGQMLDDEIPF